MRQFPHPSSEHVVPIRPEVARLPRRDSRTKPRRVRRGSSGRLLASAGQVLGIGIVCFALWVLLDAQQLIDTAVHASPAGTRRTAAIAVLRPIAYIERHLGLDGLVHAADRAIGRTTSALNTPPRPAGRHPAASVPHVSSGRSRPLGAAVTTTTAPATSVIPQPSPAHPVTILDIGDSLGEDVGIGLDDLLGQDAAVHLVVTAEANTGLADPAYYDWPTNLAQQLKQYHPAIVVVTLGGNDWQPFLTGPSTAAIPGTSFWQQAYGARVAALITEATAAGAQVFWVGLPPMGPASGFPATMPSSLDAVYAAQAAADGATYVSTWKDFSDAQGDYAQALPNAQGQLVTLRDPDGVHLAPPAGCELAASLVIHAIDSTLHISL